MKLKNESNSRKRWTEDNKHELIKLSKDNISTNNIVSMLGRSKYFIYSMASKLGISLKPKDL